MEDGRWHHVCVTWENSEGATHIFVNASLKTTGKLKNGHVISGQAKLVVGQAQGSFGGDFNASTAFAGELNQINMWSYVVDKNEIARMARYCEYNVGDVVAWSELKAHTRGNVKILPSSCPTAPGENSPSPQETGILRFPLKRATDIIVRRFSSQIIHKTAIHSYKTL